MRILITGHLGYIGSIVTDRIRQDHPEVEIVGIDLQESNDISWVTKSSFDLLIHLAAFTSVEESYTYAEGYYLNNCSKFHDLLQTQGNEFSRIIYASSFAIYNDALEIDPSSVYGSTKLEGEYITKRKTSNHLILRFANPVGIDVKLHQGQKNRDLSYPNVMMKLAKCKIDNAEMLIHNIPEMVRDYYPVSWIAEVISKSLTSNVGTHDLGSGKSVNSIELLIKLCDLNCINHRMVEAPAGTDVGTTIVASRLSLAKSLVENFENYDPIEYCVEQLSNYVEILS